MGSAPLDKAEYRIKQMRKIFRINPNTLLNFQNTVGAIAAKVPARLAKLLLNQRFDNIVAAAQKHLEDILKKWGSKCNPRNWF
jgi:hypothetical protein